MYQRRTYFNFADRRRLEQLTILFVGPLKVRLFIQSNLADLPQWNTGKRFCPWSVHGAHGKATTLPFGNQFNNSNLFRGILRLSRREVSYM